MRWSLRLRGKSFICLLSVILLFSGSCGKKGAPLPKIFSPSYVISDLTGEVKDGVLFLSFSLPKDERKVEGFRVKRVEKRQGEKGSETTRYVRIDSPYEVTLHKGRVFFFDEDLKPGITYVYEVFPSSTGGILLGSSNPFSINWKEPPGYVKVLGIEVEESGVTITWEKEEGYFYNVYRYKKGSYALFPINEKVLDIPFYRDTALPEEALYIYEVRKVRKEGERLIEGEGRPIEVAFFPKKVLPVPCNVRAEKTEEGIHLSWELKSLENVKGVRVYRHLNGKKELLKELPFEENTFIDHSYPKTKILLYSVRSVSYTGRESEDSNFAVVHVGED